MTNRVEGTITMERARIIFRNFSGLEKPMNREGDRNFNVVLPEDLAQQLTEDGWNVKWPKQREDGDVLLPHMQVAVSYKGRPPRIVLVTGRGRTDIPESMVSLMDFVDIDYVDLIINPYNWEVGGKKGVKAYLKTLFLIVKEDELEKKYADVPEVSWGDAPAAIEAAPMWEGEVVE